MPRSVKGFEPTILGQLRKDRAWSHDDLERRSDISRSLLWRYEQGHSAPTRRNLERLAVAFQVPMCTFLREGSHDLAQKSSPHEEMMALVDRAIRHRPRQMNVWVLDRCRWYRVPRLIQHVPLESRCEFKMPVEEFAMFRLWWTSNRERGRDYSRQFPNDDELMSLQFWREQILLGLSDHRFVRVRHFQGTSDYQKGDEHDNMKLATERFLLDTRPETLQLARYGFEAFLQESDGLRPFIVRDA